MLGVWYLQHIHIMTQTLKAKSVQVSSEFLELENRERERKKI